MKEFIPMKALHSSPLASISSKEITCTCPSTDCIFDSKNRLINHSNEAIKIQFSIRFLTLLFKRILIGELDSEADAKIDFEHLMGETMPPLHH